MGFQSYRVLLNEAKPEKEHDHSSHSHSTSHSHSHSLFSHSHSHSHDVSLLTSKNSSDPGVRITRLGLWVNLGMVVAKGVGGYIFNSKSLTADAAHAMSDLLSDFLTLATVSVSLRKPDKLYPKGYGKIESLGSLGVSGMLAVAGLGMGINAAQSIYGHLFPAEEMISVAATAAQHVHDSSESWLHGLLVHNHSHGDQTDLNAAWLAGGSILIKEYLFQATMKIAKEKKSTVLVANAWHHRVDCLTSIVALVAITGGHFFHIDWLDPAGGLLVSTVILQAGFSSGKQAVLELADHSAPKDVVEDAWTAAQQHVITNSKSYTSAGIRPEILDVRGIKSGPVISIDIDLRISGINGKQVLLSEAASISHSIKQDVAKEVSGSHLINVQLYDENEKHVDGWIDRDHLDN
ncbi:hypothetical protein V1511DRAFT_455820 [Dipodascopsis uninucleata]